MQIFMVMLGFASEFEVAALLQVFCFCNEVLVHFVVVQFYRALLCSFSSLVSCLPRRSWWVPVFVLKNRSTWTLQNRHAFKMITTNCWQGVCLPLSISLQNRVCLYRRLSMVTLLIPKMQIMFSKRLVRFATPMNLCFEERIGYFYQSTVTSDGIPGIFCSLQSTSIVLKILSCNNPKALYWLVVMKISYFLCCSVAGEDFVKHEIT